MKNLIKSITMLTAAFVLAACASLPTFNDKVAAAISTVTSVRDTSTALLVAKKIDVADKENIEKQANTAREGITLAVKMHAADPVGGQTKLDTTIVVLRGLNEYLIKKQLEK